MEYPKDGQSGDFCDPNELYNQIPKAPGTPVLHVARPSAEEILRTTAQLAEADFERRVLEMMLGELKDRLAAVQDGLEAKKRQIIDFNSRLAPIRRLPLEILSMIACLHVRANQQSVWVLMQTSRVWRAAALLAGDTWNYIIICSPHLILANKEQPGVVCNSVERLKCALNRIGSAPLDIEVKFGSRPRQLWFRCGPSDEAQVLALVELVPPSAHIRHLKLKDNIYNTSLTNLLQILQSWDLCRLEHLDTQSQDLIEVALKKSAKIQRIGIPPRLLRQVEAPRLMRHLEVWDHPTETLDSSDLAHFTNLISLRIGSGISTHTTTTIITMPHLRRLTLCGYGQLWPITCLNITYLDLDPPIFSHMHTGDTIHLPRLKEFVYRRRAFSETPFLQYFSAPHLEVLDATDEGANQHTVIRAMNIIWPQIESRGTTAVHLDPPVLKIHHVSVNVKLLSRVLYRLTRCVELHLLQMRVSADIFELICPTTQNSKKKSVCLPALKVLVIDQFRRKGRAFANEATYLDAATRFLQRRKTIYHPLQRLSIIYQGTETNLRGDTINEL